MKTSTKNTIIAGIFTVCGSLIGGTVMEYILTHNYKEQYFEIKNKIASSGVSVNDEDSVELIVSQLINEYNNYKNTVDMLLAENDDINQSYKESIEKIDELNYEIAELGQQVSPVYMKNSIDESQIDEIEKNIKKSYDDYDGDFFNDLRTDVYLVEIFYKMYISEEPYYYCNIVKAFEKYGIDIENMKLNESDLIIWDMERLYAIYNMKKSIAGDLDSDEVIEEKEFFYNEYRVTLNRYSDTLDYGNWRKTYTNRTIKQIDEGLHNNIMNYYKKFVINFTFD